MSKDIKALKSGIWYIVANFIVKGMTLLTTPIFTRLLSKDQYGEYSNFLTWTNIAIILVTMKMEATLISAKFDYSGKADQYNLSVLGLTAFLTATWAVIINIFSKWFTGLLGIQIVYINLMLIYCFFYAVVNIFQISERFQYQYKKSVFIALLVAISTTSVSVLFVLNMQNKLWGRIVGGILPTIVIGFFLTMLFIKKGKKIDLSVWPYALKICVPYIPHLLSLQILNSIDRVMITKICGASDNAVYTVAYTCGHMVTILMTSMNSAFVPWLGDKLIENDYKQIRKVSGYFIVAFCILAMVMMLMAPEILFFMGGADYVDAIYVMTPVAMGCVCQFLYTLFVNIEQYTKKTIGMAFASVGAALLNYILNLILIPKYGYIAAAYTTLIGYLFLLVVHMVMVKSIGYMNVYNYQFIIIITIIMLLITMGINILYKNSMFRYCLILLCLLSAALIGYYKREITKKYFKYLKKNKK